MSDIRDLIARLDITGHLSMVGVNPMERTAYGDVHYQATMNRGDRAIDLYCSTSAGAPAPSLADALLAAGRRAGTVERTGSLEEWARALGMDPTDSEIERWYDGQVSEAVNLRAFLDDDGFAELERCVAEEYGETAGNGAQRKSAQDAIGHPARSDEMTFQEPRMAAANAGQLGSRLIAGAAAAATTGGVIGAAIGTAAGRAVRRLPPTRSAATGGLLGLAAGALVAARFVRQDRQARQNGNRETVEDLAAQRAAIETGRD